MPSVIAAPSAMPITVTARKQGGQVPLAPYAGTLQPPPSCGPTTTSPLPAGNAWPAAVRSDATTARGRGGQAPLALKVGTPHPPPYCSRATALPPPTSSAWPSGRRNAEVPIAMPPVASSTARIQGRAAAQVNVVGVVHLGLALDARVAAALPVASQNRKVLAPADVHVTARACARGFSSLNVSTSESAGAGQAGLHSGGCGANGASAREGSRRPARPGGRRRRQPSAAVGVRSPPIPSALPPTPAQT
jgi:hypothetical protein